MVPHFFEFYIPVLKVLSTIEEKNINNIIDESSYSVGLSAEDKKITTKKNGQPQYRINISWAISDLYQAGFIDRVSRGTYVITIEGLEFLENHPENPTRAILAEKSGKFQYTSIILLIINNIYRSQCTNSVLWEKLAASRSK